MRSSRLRLLPLCILLFCLSLAGCAPAAETPDLPATLPEPSEAPEYTLRYIMGAQVETISVSWGETVPPPDYTAGDARLVGWTDESGGLCSPGEGPATADRTYTALLRPLLRGDADYAFADANGLFRPAASWTRGDMAAALGALLVSEAEGEALFLSLAAGLGALAEQTVWDPAAPLAAGELSALLEQLFCPDTVAALLSETDPAALVTRAQAVMCIESLLSAEFDRPAAAVYFPDVSPDRACYGAVCAAAAEGGRTPEDFAALSQDGFLWLAGYLYRWDGSGYFPADVTIDGLYFDAGGQYTSGSPELDAYVAQTIAERAAADMTRLEKLETMFSHIRDDFQYLRRNAYEAGATGWEIEDALTFFSTGKGNCYCYAGAFWALARGLGYHAVCWCGTISKNRDPHGWVEIWLDGVPYICDPEIQMSYWREQKYYDTFMMTYEYALGWQYEAPGRAA